MANNRMFLVHRPSGLAVFLGKRMGHKWYTTDRSISVQNLFDVLENEDGRDDFAIALEDATGATLAIGEWEYGPHRDDELVQLILTDKAKVPNIGKCQACGHEHEIPNRS